MNLVQIVYVLCFFSGLYLSDISPDLMILGVREVYINIAAKAIGTIGGFIGYIALAKYGSVPTIPQPPEKDESDEESA